MLVAAVQMAPKFKAPKENLQIIQNLAREAAAAGAKLAVFPELATTGYSFMSPTEIAPYTEHLEGPTFQVLAQLARDLNMAIAWGMATQAEGKYYNTQVLALPNGAWTHYHKLNSWGNDFLWATEGDESPPITRFLDKNIGLLICRDVRDKGSKASGLKDLYQEGDADIVCFSSNFGRGGFPSVTWVDFAQENNTWFVVSNRYGLESHNDFGHGGVCIISPTGKVYCEGLRWGAPCIVYAEVP